MGRLRVFSSTELIRLLGTQGFAFIRQRGSHIVLQKTVEGGTVTVVVPEHREIRIGTLQSIIRQSKLPRELFEN